ncbi:MAG: sugar ABC transporter substrate-binding protein [Rhodothermales bacterium]|nr:sugar ABC transporter substrate-binding protein [Rhodothermales bacterium]
MAAVLLLSAGCQQADTPATPEKPRVALIMKSLANEFFVSMADGARTHQAAHADAYELIINGIKNESDLSQQVAMVENMVAIGVDAIVIAPADSRALVPVLKRAADAGIVVINIDNRLDEAVLASSGASIPFVGPDNRKGAEKVGTYLASHLQAGDEVAIIGGIPTAFNAQQREQGFRDAMASAGLEIVSVQSGSWEQASANTVAAALLGEYPNLKALLCSNDNMALGAVAAVQQAGLAEQVRIVGFDNIEAVRQLIEEGRMLATADQYGTRLAVFGIETALRRLQGDVVDGVQETPVDLITAAPGQ